MGILDNLRKQAQVLEVDSKSGASSSNKNGIQQHKAFIAAFQEIYGYLHKFVRLVLVVRPELKFSYPIEGLGKISDLKQGGYALLTECSDRNKVIILSFKLNFHKPYKLKLEDFENTIKRLEELKGCGFTPEIVTEGSGKKHSGAAKISLQGDIPSIITFRADGQTNKINIEIKNFECPGTIQYSIDPDAISSKFLDEFGKFILRKKSRFLDELAALKISKKSDRATMTASKEPDTPELPVTEEMSSSLIESLFNRSSRLFLTYREEITEIASKTKEFVVGRDDSCSMIVKAEYASREHARFLYRKGKFVLIDHSKNGTFIKMQGGKEVYINDEEYPLSSCGLISLGKSISASNEDLIYFFCE